MTFQRCNPLFVYVERTLLRQTALIGAQTMGLEIAQAIEVVCSMSRSDFYKSMTIHASSQIWQDVYHPETSAGIAYVKVTLRHDGSIVIQFKEK